MAVICSIFFLEGGGQGHSDECASMVSEKDGTEGSGPLSRVRRSSAGAAGRPAYFLTIRPVTRPAAAASTSDPRNQPNATV